MNNKKFMRVGVIGVGSMGFHHARNYADLPHTDLVAVADSNWARATEVAKHFDCLAYADYSEMLARENLDAVSVVVPTKLHRRIALDTLNAGVHTLLEKPIACTVAEAEELVCTSHTQGVVLQIGHIERFNPAVQELKRRMKAGELGKISSLVARRVGVIPPRVKDVNVIVDLAVHDIDIVMYLLDQEPTEVSATAGAALLSDHRLDHSEIFLKFGDTGCFIQANWITPIKIRMLSVTGDTGHAELNYVTQRLEIFQSNLERQYDNFGDFVIRFGTPRTLAVDLPPQEPLRLELLSFLRAASGRGAVVVSPEEGLRALAVVERVKHAVEKQALPATAAN